MVDAVARRVADIYGLSAAGELTAPPAQKSAPKRARSPKHATDAEIKPARKRTPAPSNPADPQALEVVYPPKAGPGYVEQVRVRYERSEHEPTTAKRVERKRG